MSRRTNVTIIASRRTADHQGHTLLARYLSASGYKLAGWNGTPPQRMIAWILRRFSAYRGMTPSNSYYVFLVNVLRPLLSPGHELFHLIWGDHLIDRLSRPERCIVTLHQPIELWTEKVWAKVSQCAGVICMAERECLEIRRRFPGVPCGFIPHGIDVGFWRPMATPPRRQICAIGRYMRNFEMLVRLARVLLERHPDVTFRWLVNPDFKVPPAIAATLPTERFELVRNLSEAELHLLYAESWLFCTPYNNITASNAIVESMATGTPVFTTRVGGMSSYAGEGAITMVANNDDDAMLMAVTACLASTQVRDELSARARRHAEQYFNWPVVVAAHEAFYNTLPSSR
jgi:glycosyltransferase involved in cell wall biosynthesis